MTKVKLSNMASQQQCLLKNQEGEVKLTGGGSSTSSNGSRFPHTSNVTKIPIYILNFTVNESENIKVKINFLVHSGVCETLINWSTHKKMGKPNLKQTNKTIFPYSATKPLVLLGKCSLRFHSTYFDKWVNTSVYVVAEDNNSPCIMGRSLAEKLGVLKMDSSTSMKWNAFLSNGLKRIISDEKRPMAEVIRLRNTKIEFLVDSGASVTLIDRLTYAKIGSPALTQTDTVLFAHAAKKPLTLLGKFETILVRAEFTSRTNVYVADVEKPSCVLSKADSVELGLLKLQPNLFTLFECSQIML